MQQSGSEVLLRLQFVRRVLVALQSFAARVGRLAGVVGGPFWWPGEMGSIICFGAEGVLGALSRLRSADVVIHAIAFGTRTVDSTSQNVGRRPPYLREKDATADLHSRLSQRCRSALWLC